MLEIADGIILAAIILAFLPYLLVIVLYLVPPTIGIAVGAGLGYVVAAGEGQSLITDLFEKIPLWDLKVEEAMVSERADGRFDVTMTVAATKFEADGQGQQTEVPLDMPIDIGIFTKNPDKVTDGDEHVLHFEKQRIRSGTSTLTFVVDDMPSYVAIDPYNKLIDRNSDDNVEQVDEVTVQFRR